MKKLPIILILVSLMIGSCGPYRADKNPDPLQETERVVLLDHVLKRYLNIVKSKTERLPGGQLNVKIAIENEENSDIWADVRVIFRDADGFEIETTNWEPVQFHRRKVTTFAKNSLNASAQDYRILIRNIK